MNLSAPTAIVFWISVILFILALIAGFGHVGFLSFLSPFYWALIAWIVLAAGNVLKGL